MIALAFNLIAVGSAVALTVVLAFAVARNAPPRLRYVIAVIAFLAAAILPFLEGERPARPREASRLALADRAGRPIEVAAPAALLWLTVSALLLAREALGHAVLHFRRREWDRAPRELRERLHWPHDVDLYLSDNEAPATIGLVNPVVVLPVNWLDERVARHELAHARWRDPLVNAVVRIIRAILWPSVPLWFLERVIRTEREVAADAFAVQDGNAIEYASMLVSAAGRRVPRAATALGNGMGLEERIHRLFAAARPSRLRLTLGASLLVIGTAATSAVPRATTDLVPPLHVVPARATPEYRMATRAMNEILSRTRFHNHEGTATVHQLLGQIRASGTIAPLLDGLGAPDLRTREAVAWMAGELRDPALVPALIVRLDDPDPRVRETSAWALGMIGDRRAAGALKAAMHSSDSRTRHGATWAFERIHKE